MILVRHGETDWNRKRRIQGQSDVALTDLGRRQAARVAARLAGERIAAVYSSDLSRAYETALAIATPHGLEVERVLELRERAFGDWEGLTVEEIAERYADEYEKWVHDRFNARIPNGESLSQLYERAWRIFQLLRERHAGETAVLVGHGAALSVILSEVLGVDWKHRQGFLLENGSISTVTTERGRTFVTCLNDTCHLEGLEKETGLEREMAEEARTGPGQSSEGRTAR